MKQLDLSRGSSLREPFRSTLQYTGAWLERLAFAGLAGTAIAFAFDPIQPRMQVGFVAIRTTMIVALVSVTLWLLARVTRALQFKVDPRSAERVQSAPAVPVRLALAAVLWLMVLGASTASAPAHRSEALNIFIYLLLGALSDKHWDNSSGVRKGSANRSRLQDSVGRRATLWAGLHTRSASVGDARTGSIGALLR